MSMSKRFQIPTTAEEQNLYKKAAKKQGISAAEWARRLLREEARQILEEKSWEQFFKKLGQVDPSGDLEAPERFKARPISWKID